MLSSPELPPITLRLAVCLFPGVCALDYQGPIELLGFLSPVSPNRLPSSPKFLLEITYLAPEKDVQAGGVTPVRGPKVFADATYEEIIAKGEQFNVVLIPGGELYHALDRANEHLKFIHPQDPAHDQALYRPSSSLSSRTNFQASTQNHMDMY